jgi:hypothetical protein
VTDQTPLERLLPVHAPYTTQRELVSILSSHLICAFLPSGSQCGVPVSHNFITCLTLQGLRPKGLCFDTALIVCSKVLRLPFSRIRSPSCCWFRVAPSPSGPADGNDHQLYFSGLRRMQNLHIVTNSAILYGYGVDDALWFFNMVVVASRKLTEQEQTLY